MGKTPTINFGNAELGLATAGERSTLHGMKSQAIARVPVWSANCGGAVST